MRRTIPLVIGLAMLGGAQVVGAQEKPVPQQIAEAVSPLPEPMRDGATVLEFRGGELVTLRQGTNEMICLADDPARLGFHAACYHKDLEPFMARGRELRAEGKDQSERKAIRRAEIQSGKLVMPNHPSALYSLSNREDEDVEGASALYVVYIPYATQETVGISTRPARDRPWLMEAGEPWAHIMISGRRP